MKKEAKKKETVVIKRISVSLSVESCNLKSQKCLCEIQPTRYLILNRPNDAIGQEWFDGGFRSTVAKSELMKIDSFTNNVIRDTGGGISFYTFCLQDDEAAATQLLIAHFREFVEKIHSNALLMYEHFTLAICRQEFGDFNKGFRP